MPSVKLYVVHIGVRTRRPLAAADPRISGSRINGNAVNQISAALSAFQKRLWRAKPSEGRLVILYHQPRGDGVETDQRRMLPQAQRVAQAVESLGEIEHGVAVHRPLQHRSVIRLTIACGPQLPYIYPLVLGRQVRNAFGEGKREGGKRLCLTDCLE